MKLINESYIEVKKSKFYGYLYSINDINEVNDILEDIKHEHKSSSHVVYAYKCGVYEKRHEDKEPSGTSGMQILNMINIKKKDNVLIVVVRYFGGTLLGVGPLSKAYRDSAITLLNS